MITSYEYIAPKSDGWHFEKTELSPISLLVGLSGAGKTRFLNTIFNIARTAVYREVESIPFRRGHWKISVHVDDRDYYWEYAGSMNEDSPKITYELVTVTQNGKEETIIERNHLSFKFKGEELPKLNDKIASINLLKEESIIEPIHRVFSRGLRRKFFEDGLNNVKLKELIEKSFFTNFAKNPNLDTLFPHDFSVSTRLYIFQQYYKEKYQAVIDNYKDVFPSIKDFKIEIHENLPNTLSPLLKIKEKGVKPWLPLSELSSGMQKVMLIMTDVLSLPGNGIYMIDEYENSLGTNAIDFLPEFLSEFGGNNQFIITTHHPYLINNMPMKNWIVLNRKGSKVRFQSGKESEKKYGPSKHQAFTKLINDPFYLEGV
ncbi:ATP-binding protein [bacterium]|nr:ATP-binding protein [bacterium]